MANRAQQKIKQTRGILIIVVLACAAKLVKTIMDGNPQTAQIVILAVVIAVLVAVLLFYNWIDRYTKKEQASYGQSQSPAGKITSQSSSQSLQSISKEIFKKDK